MHRAGAAWNRNLSSAAASSTHRVMLRLSVETPDASKKEHNFKNKVTAGLAWSLLSPYLLSLTPQIPTFPMLAISRTAFTFAYLKFLLDGFNIVKMYF